MISRADRLMQNNKGGEGLRISQWDQKSSKIAIYITVCTRAIKTRGLYILNPLFEGQKRFSRRFFRKILPLCMVSIQERVMMASVR